MKVLELVAAVRAKNPAALAGLSDPAAARFLRISLGMLREGVEACEEGKVVLQGLGTFNVRKPKADAPAGAAPKRVVRFVAAKAVEPKEGAVKAAKPAKAGKAA